MATSGINDFTRGDTKKYTVKFTDGSTPPEPISVDGGTIWMTFKLNKTDSDPGALQVSSACSEAVPASPKGLCYIVLTADETKQLEPNTKYFYDIQFVNAAGEVTTIISGKVKVLAEITEAA